jgi:hypothetical protein
MKRSTPTEDAGEFSAVFPAQCRVLSGLLD